MRRLARAQLRRERDGQSVQPTQLVHEVYLRLLGADIDWRDRTHFVSVSARVMRRILVEHARARRARKRGGEDVRVTTIGSDIAVSVARPVDVLDLDAAMERLRDLDARQADVVELCYFGGLTYRAALPGERRPPAGAYKADSMLASRATFGFVSKYKKGTTVPTGNTEFQFHAANLNFHSENYDWLVVSGARAQYKGTGTINGAGTFKFLLTAIDGQITGGGAADRFRIKIWHYDPTLQADVVDYDNQINLSEEGSAAEGTTTGGGSIVIHKK